MGEARSTHGGDEKFIKKFEGKTEGKKPHRDLYLDGRIMLKLIFNI
jgi:hypothetical protein